jgi:hypothetical protein
VFHGREKIHVAVCESACAIIADESLLHLEVSILFGVRTCVKFISKDGPSCDALQHAQKPPTADLGGRLELYEVAHPGKLC